jgi:WD40 repeat protein
MLAGVRGGRNETVFIWDPITGEVVREMTETRPPDEQGLLFPSDLSWHPDGSRIATDGGRWEDLVLTWDLAADDNPHSLIEGYPEVSGSDYTNIFDLEWSPSGQLLLASGSDGSTPSRSIIHLYDATTGEVIRTISSAFGAIWGPTDEQFAGLSHNDDHYVINIWDTETGEVVSSFEAHENGTLTMAWNYDANVIAGATIEDNLILWLVETGRKLDIEEIQTPSARSVEWQPNSNQLAIADLEEGVTIINFEFGS